MTPAANAFLAQHGWPIDRVEPFPADWSSRRYARVRRFEEPARAVLMVTKPDADFFAFIRIAQLLRGLGLAAPELYAVDMRQGLLLLEDFGDRNFGRLMDDGAQPLPLLRRAVDTLCLVQRRTLNLNDPELPRFDGPRFLAQLDPVMDNFIYTDTIAAKDAWRDAWRKVFPIMESQPQALLLRDFMPDNLMDIPPRDDGQNVGLLDFELAGIGPIAYDVASLVEQVRRDLPESTRRAVYDHYLAQWPELDRASFLASVDILSLQRHARIFARLKKMNKPDFYMRSCAFLQEQLEKPACAPLRGWFLTYLPQYFT